MIHIRLKPLHYTAADGPFLFGLTPLEHQRNTLTQVEHAMQEKRTLAIINASVTGSGKTLANYAYSLLNRPTPTIGVYPTNELIKDQERSLRERDVKGLIRIDRVELDQWQKRLEMRAHVEVLHTIMGSWVEECPIVLTNPDILYLLMYNVYAYHHAFLNYRDRILHNIINNYPIIVFDEFHLYNVKQEANAAFIAAVAARLAPGKPHIFIFSSATPDLGRLGTYLQRVGIEQCPVHTPPSVSGKLVCEPIDLHIVAADLTHWRGLETIETEFERIQTFLDQYPSASGVFIMDSVYEAKLLAQSLAQRFGWEQVGELHGYLDADARKDALERRFTVGTTTIDVGVDFTGKKAKDFIVFEARSAEQFIQRLGRLGRQRREQQNIPNFALALVPEYVYNSITEQHSTILQVYEWSRDELSTTIREAYAVRNTFTGYITHYAPLEATATAKRIIEHYPSDRKQDISEKLKQIIIDLFPRSDGSPALFDSLGRRQWAIWKQFGESKKKSWNINGKTYERETIFFPELEQFRGSSNLSCAIYDHLDEARGFFPFKMYHFPFVARRTQFYEVEENIFLEHLERFRMNFPEKVETFNQNLKRDQVLDYVIVKDLVEGKPQQLGFELNFREIDNQNHIEQLHRFHSLRMHLDAPQPCSVEKANDAIELISNTKDGWLCWVSQSDPFYLTNIHKLPPLFELFPLRVVTGGGGTLGDKNKPWSIALGLSAIFMDSLPLYRDKKDRAIFA
jgi:CRISPR-associated helicase Cas3